MNRKSNFLIVLLSAALTIAALFASVGKPPYMKKYHHSSSYGHCQHHHPADEVQPAIPPTQ
ncbi:MAG: hypothetical protein IPL35_01185 [Sphingobacteriales bacterium]|nr:hypothetical protein [Sphingobacteriales bacterium]